MKILQINTVVNTGSTGRIAEEIGNLIISEGHESFIAYGRDGQKSNSHTIKIGNKIDQLFHFIKTKIFDNHGFGSKMSTILLIKKIKKIKPDIIHLHIIHGYYLNIEILFNYLKSSNLPIIWTFHDCWAFTGHCSHFESVNCNKWETQCESCPNKSGYPASWIFDNSKSNFIRKKNLLTGINNLTIVSPSKWLNDHLNKSFLHNYPVQIVNNGIDLNIFRHSDNQNIFKKYKLDGKIIILGVANTWKKRKAFSDFIKLSKSLNEHEKIVLVGVTKKQRKILEPNMIGISRTNNLDELVSLYSMSDVFINPTYADTFPTTNIEALACGTPVITYNTGGSPEIIDDKTGFIVDKGNISQLIAAVRTVTKKGQSYYSENCRKRAEKHFNKIDCYNRYIKLYKKLEEIS